MRGIVPIKSPNLNPYQSTLKLAGKLHGIYIIVSIIRIRVVVVAVNPS